MKITMLGAGSFGTGMSKHLADLGNDILMWTIDKEQADSINSTGRNTFCFQDTVLPDNIKCTLDMDEALSFSDYVIMAIPTQFEREVCRKVAATGKKKPAHAEPGKRDRDKHGVSAA